LILGIGNVLLGDEGIGVHVVRELQRAPVPDGVVCLDGGTGGLLLLEPMQAAERIVLVDATVDGAAAGTVRRLHPRFSSDYPPTLTAHDIGLKDLLDALYLLGARPDVTLFAVSIATPQPMAIELSPALAPLVPRLAEQVLSAARESPSKC
jgi:hydrogenase maturation protease